MADIKFEDRVRAAFPDQPHLEGYPFLRRLTPPRARELSDHQRWVRSHGRFGEPLIWEGVRVAFFTADHAAVDFSQVTLIRCEFEWTDLRLASFAVATLHKVKFKNCDVEGCDFSGARLEDVIFENCFDLDKANFDKTVFSPPARSDLSAKARAKKIEQNLSSNL